MRFSKLLFVCVALLGMTGCKKDPASSVTSAIMLAPEAQANGVTKTNSEESSDDETVVEEEEGTEGLDYYIQDDGTYYVAVGTATDVSKIIVPSHHNGKEVTGVRDFGFYSNSGAEITYFASKFTSMELPSTIKYIGIDAISFCDLTSIIIPSSVTTIAGTAFNKDKKLTSVSYDGTMEEWNKITFGRLPFYNCTSLKKVSCSDGDIEVETE